MATAPEIAFTHEPFAVGDRLCAYGTITLSDSYDTGGDVWTNDQFHMEVEHLQIDAIHDDTTPAVVENALASKAILAYKESGSDLTEISGGTDTSGIAVNFVAFGRPLGTV